MEAWIIWLIAASVLLVVEIATQMMWALCLTIGSLGAMVCALAGLDPGWQVAAVAVLSTVAYLLLLPLYRRWHARQDARAARTGMDALEGRRATVTHAIRPGQLGRARIDGDNWQVRAPGVDREIRAGEEVSVTGYDSIILTVTPLD